MTNTDIPVEGGFARFPQNYIYLPISPQSKLLLVVFCAFANKKGESWFPYEKLAEMLQRSKASISAYMAELVDGGLVTYQRHRFGNGHNAHMTVKVVGWEDLLAHWAGLTATKKSKMIKASQDDTSRKAQTITKDLQTAAEEALSTESAEHAPAHPAPSPSVQEAECGVQPTECKDPSGPITKIQLTKTRDVVWDKDDERAWRAFRPQDSDPISVGNGTPAPALLRKVVRYHDHLVSSLGLLEPPRALEAARIALEAFVRSRRLEASADQLAAAAEAISEVAKTPEAISAAMEALHEVWQPHWRRLSEPTQIKKTCRAAADASMPSFEERQFVGRMGNRAWIAKGILKKLHCEPDISIAA